MEYDNEQGNAAGGFSTSSTLEKPIPSRILGKSSLHPLAVSAVGLGCMGFSHGYGPGPDRDESIRLIRQAYELGYTYFDTAEGYANGANEQLVGEAIAPFRSQVVLATKLHIPEVNDDPRVSTDLYGIIRSHLEASLARLRTDYVDLYYQHRMNKTVSAKDVAKAMEKLIDEGLIRGWGQSQSTAEEIQSAHAACPLTAVQSEFSLMERMFEAEVIPTCDRLGIGFVPFSPMGAGFLSGAYKPKDQSEYIGDDVRRGITRFAKENMEANQPLLDVLDTFSKQWGITKAQLSLAWMLCKYDFIAPIPGSRKTERLKENLSSSLVSLACSDIEELERVLATVSIHGNRTDEDILALYQDEKTTPTRLN